MSLRFMFPLFIIGLSTIFSVSTVVPSQDYRSDRMRDLTRATVLIFSPEDPALPCNEYTDPGCSGPATAFGLGAMVDGRAEGVLVTNKHVVKSRSVALVFYPREAALSSYDYDLLHKWFFHNFDIKEIWGGGGALGASCPTVPLYLDRVHQRITTFVPDNRVVARRDERLGYVSVARVIARHTSLDLAIPQGCPVVKPIVKSADCNFLKRGARLYTAGSSPEYGKFTWLLGELNTCHKDELTYTMPIEGGRSGSPIVTSGDALVGVHAFQTRGTERGGGVPSGRVLEFYDKLRIAKVVAFFNRTRHDIEYRMACGHREGWGRRGRVPANGHTISKCEDDIPRGKGAKPIPNGMYIRVRNPMSKEADYAQYRVPYRWRFVIAGSHGGTNLTLEHDVIKYTFAYEHNETGVGLWAGGVARGRSIRPITTQIRRRADEPRRHMWRR